MKELIETVKEKGLEILGADEEDLEKYKEAIPLVMEGLASAKDMLDALKGGDKTKFEGALTEFEDVNRTLEAIHKMDQAIADTKNGVQLEDVLEMAAKIVKIAVTIGALA